MGHQLDSLDYKILKLISGNARIPFLEIARECNVSGAAIHQRVQKLISIGIIKGSEYILDSNKIGFETCAYMGLYLQNPGQFATVLEALKKIRSGWRGPSRLFRLRKCLNVSRR